METSKLVLGWNALIHLTFCLPAELSLCATVACIAVLQGLAGCDAGGQEGCALAPPIYLQPGPCSQDYSNARGMTREGHRPLLQPFPPTATPAPLGCQGSLTFLLLHSSVQREKNVF